MTTSENISITMCRETLLVIFEFLAQSYEQWRRSGPNSDETSVLSKPDAGQRVALWRLEGETERTLPEIFSAQCKELIAAEKQRLSAELYGAKS